MMPRLTSQWEKLMAEERSSRGCRGRLALGSAAGAVLHAVPQGKKRGQPSLNVSSGLVRSLQLSD